MILPKIKKSLDRSLEFITAVSMGGLVLDVCWQVITRFLLGDPSSWTEELATYLMIWVGLLGAAVALNRGAHLGIDYFVGKLDEKKRILCELLGYASVAAFSISVLMIGGSQLVAATFKLGQTAPATGLKIGYVYLSVPISGFFISLYSIDFFLKAVVNLKKTGRYR